MGLVLGVDKTDPGERMDIYLVGSLAEPMAVTSDVIESLLHGEPQNLSHGGAFTGKPVMQIYADEQWVLKINSNRSFSSESIALKWCEIQLEKEKTYGVYHPQRSWLVIEQQQGWLAANITPRLKPLNLFDFSTFPEHERLWVFKEVLHLYCTFAARFDKHLDEGLSNFGCLNGKLYYLDDDIYPWDSFCSFSAMLANWLRKSESLCLGEEDWRELGRFLWPLLRTHSSEADDVVHESLADQVVGSAEHLKQAFLSELRPDYRVSMAQTASGDFSSSEPIGVIADVHANLPAFEAVLNELAKRGVRQIMHLGDIVGYGPHPNACIELAKQHNIFCVRGNHDHYVAHEGDVRVASSSMAKWTLDWTLEQLGGAEKQWLGALPVRHRMPGWMAVHGSPIDKTFFNGYVYNMTAEKNLDYLRSADIPVCLHGHSHIQGIYGLKGRVVQALASPERVNLDQFTAALVCPGSVGQPRDGSPRAEAALFYPDSMDVEMFALDYDIESVTRDMEGSGFPSQVMERLLAGR